MAFFVFYFLHLLTSESYFFMYLCPTSFSFHLQPVILFHFISWALWMLLQCMFVGVWGWACVFHDLLVSQILWEWNHHMTSSVSSSVSKALWQSCSEAPTSYLPPLAYKGPLYWYCPTLPVCRVLDSGLFGLSVVILCFSLTFPITDKKANEAHFQRLSKYSF